MEAPRSATVVGAGSMGTAIGYLLASSGVEVVFWSRSRDVVDSINKGRVNARYLPRLRLPEGVSATTDLEEAVSRGELLSAAVRRLVPGL